MSRTPTPTSTGQSERGTRQGWRRSRIQLVMTRTEAIRMTTTGDMIRSSLSCAAPSTPPAIETARSIGRIAGSDTAARIGTPMARLAIWLPRRTPSTGVRRLVRPPPKSARPQPIEASRPRPMTATAGETRRCPGIPVSSRLPMTRARTFALGGRRAALAVALGGAVALALPVAALDQVTIPPSQEGRYVYDLAGIWNASAIDQAQSTAVAIRDRTGAELAIVSWPSDDSDVSTGTARADAITIMDTWGVGRAGVNDGLVVLFDMDFQSRSHGQIYLYAGSGFLDRYLNEDEASAVVNATMLPRAVDGDLGAALLDGLQRIDH